MISQPQPVFRYLDILTVLFVTVLMISQIMAQKLFAVFGITFTTAIIIFPVSYIIGDILTEVYGYARTRRIIWLGFMTNIIMVLFLAAAVHLPPAEGWHNQNAFETILNQVPRIVIASLLAYLLGEFVNSYILAKMKIKMGGRHLWMRTIGSTIVGQAVDTSIFMIVAFGGILPAKTIALITISAYLFKVSYEILVTPVTVLVVEWIKKKEGIDYYDSHTDFRLFNFKLNERG